MIAPQFITYLLPLCLTFATAKFQERMAVAVLSPNNGSDVQGIIYFVQKVENGEVYITGNITGLTPGKHGFHVHEKGDLSGGCETAGAHYNPQNRTHGSPKDVERHVGDLKQVEADKTMVAYVDTKDYEISLSGCYSIIGRSVVVHALRDDYGRGGTEESLTSGSSGARVACGVIGIQHPVTSWADSAAMSTEAEVAFIGSTVLAAILFTLT